MYLLWAFLFFLLSCFYLFVAVSSLLLNWLLGRILLAGLLLLPQDSYYYWTFLLGHFSRTFHRTLLDYLLSRTTYWTFFFGLSTLDPPRTLSPGPCYSGLSSWISLDLLPGLFPPGPPGSATWPGLLGLWGWVANCTRAATERWMFLTLVDQFRVTLTSPHLIIIIFGGVELRFLRCYSPTLHPYPSHLVHTYTSPYCTSELSHISFVFFPSTYVVG